MGKLSYLGKENCPKRIYNCSSNVANGKVCTVLLKSIGNGKWHDSPLNWDKQKRCEQVIKSADRIDKIKPGTVKWKKVEMN